MVDFSPDKKQEPTKFKKKRLKTWSFRCLFQGIKVDKRSSMTFNLLPTPTKIFLLLFLTRCMLRVWLTSFLIIVSVGKMSPPIRMPRIMLQSKGECDNSKVVKWKVPISAKYCSHQAPNIAWLMKAIGMLKKSLKLVDAQFWHKAQQQKKPDNKGNEKKMSGKIVKKWGNKPSGLMWQDW